jgi:hypothetical protein
MIKFFRKIQQKMLLKPENTLNLFNVIELRTLPAFQHKELYKQIKKDTAILTKG